METSDITPKTPGRPKGTPRTGGRQKGTPNKITKAVRVTLVKFINRNMRTLQRDFDELEPKDRLTLLERFLPYVLPKQATIKAEISDLTDDELNAVASRILNEIKSNDDE
jgi:hypothetical protein